MEGEDSHKPQEIPSEKELSSLPVDHDSQDLQEQQKKAEEELSKLPEEEKATLNPILELQKQRDTLSLKFLKELRELEHHYDNQYLSLYTSRSTIAQNLPDFWLKVLKNNPLTSTMIFDQDEELLKYLTDIKHMSEPNSDNFTLEFHFKDNKFIHNSVLTKKYILGSNSEVERGEGTEIKWKSTNLTQKTKKFKTRGKNKKKGIKIEQIPSFFTFFKTVTDEDEQENSEDEEMGGLLEEDYENACELRDEIVPNAIYYYLGTADDPLEDEEKGTGKKIDGSGKQKADCKNQ